MFLYKSLTVAGDAVSNIRVLPQKVQQLSDVVLIVLALAQGYVVEPGHHGWVKELCPFRPDVDYS